MEISAMIPGGWAKGRHPSPELVWVILAIIAGTSIKLWLAATTIGTNDLPGFYLIGRQASVFGTVEVYRIFPVFNQPPLVTSILWILDTFLGLPPRLFLYVFRLTMIFADVGSAFVIWELASRYWVRRRALVTLTLFALNPVLLMVSGFHGNTDPVFIFFVLLAAYALVVGKSWPASALCLGLAINIKIVPILVIPAFFFWIPSWRQRFGFLLVLGVVVLAAFGYHFWLAFPDMMKKVFSYRSIWGTWGLGRIFMPRQGGVPAEWYVWFPLVSRYVLLGLVFLSALIKARQSFSSGLSEEQRGRFLLEAIGWAFLVFLIVTPGFGVQYLSWLVGPGVFLGLFGLLAYTILASVFLFRVYTFWSGGFPWYYADSNSRGQWVGFDMALDRWLWILLILWGASLVASGIRSIKDPQAHFARSR